MVTYVGSLIAGFAVLFGLKDFNYVVFHNLVEHACVIVFVAVFLLVWNARHVLENGFLICAGVACLPVAVLDWFHTATYFGMPGFESYGKNLTVQLWLEARFVQATSILVGMLFLHRARSGPFLLAVWSLLGTGLAVLALARCLPVCFVDGQGLTSFKIGVEYVVAVEFATALVLLVRRRRAFDPEVFGFLVGFLALEILSEGFFTLYTDVYGFANFLGHICKLLACFCLYRAIVGIGLGKPYALMFREIQQREEALEKTLHGILPICSGCKKIRTSD